MSSGDEWLEEATGNVNGFNVDFSTSYPYVSGTLFVLGNGRRPTSLTLRLERSAFASRPAIMIEFW
jgi:hypothetical protein